MKLTTTTFVSVDGVMQGIGSPDEDPSGGFERGGWTTPLWDNEAGAFLNEVYGRADAFLFGRRTYEIFAGSWGAVADPGINPIAAALNSRPKYVASTTLTNPRWANTTVLSSEVAAAVGELRAKPGGELQVHGSGALIRWLLDNDLVDELNLFIFPVVVGQGARLFPDTGPDRALELVESRATPKGVTMRNGRPRVTIHMAASLDGFIARRDGGVDWLETSDNFDGGATMTPETAEGFLEAINCYVMGSRTYETALDFEAKGLGWSYGDKPTVVLTRRTLRKSRNSVEFYSGDLGRLVGERLKPNFPNIWFVGGGEVSAECLRLQLADEVRYSIMPILIGDGISFFQGLDKDLALHLLEATPYTSGMVALRYEVRK